MSKDIEKKKQAKSNQPTNRNSMSYQKEDLKFTVAGPSTRWCSSFSVFIFHLENQDDCVLGFQKDLVD